MSVRGWGRAVVVTAALAGCGGDAGTEARFACVTAHAADASCLVGREYCALTTAGGERFARCAPMPAACPADDPAAIHPCPCLRAVLSSAGAANVDCGSRPLAAGWATTATYSP